MARGRRRYGIALERGEGEARLNLGSVLHEPGDLAGEIRAYESAEAAGDSGGPLGLAFPLREQGDRDAALAAAQRAAAAGNEAGAAVVACWQWCTSPIRDWSRPFDQVVPTSRLPGPTWGRCCARRFASRRHDRSSSSA